MHYQRDTVWANLCRTVKKKFPINRVAKIVAVMVNLTVLIFFVEWVRQNLSIEQFTFYARSLGWADLILPIGLYFLSIFFHSVRLSGLALLGVAKTFILVNLSAGLNLMLPLRLGDVARIYYARVKYSVSAAKMVWIAGVEKYLDLVAVGCLLMAMLPIGMIKIGDYEIWVFVLPTILVTLLLLFVILLMPGLVRALASGLFERVWFVVERAHKNIQHHLPRALGLTVLIWGFNIAMVWAIFDILLVTEEFKLIDAVGILVVSSLALALPGAPAGLGVFEASVAAYLTHVYHIDASLAISSALMYHALLMLPQIAVTLICLAVVWFDKRI